MRSIGLPLHPILLLFLPVVLALGLYIDTLSFKIIAIVILSMVAYSVFLLPLKIALVFMFLYVGIEGFFKVVSNYHPMIHVGTDLILITLCFKVLLKTFFTSFDIKDYPPLTRLFMFHFLWLVVVMFNPYALSIISSVAGAKIYVSMVLMYFFGYYLTESARDVRLFMAAFVGIAVVHCVFGLYQGYYGPASVIAIHPRYAVQLAKYEHFAFRPFGLTNLPGGPAIFMYISTPFLLYFVYFFRSYLLRSVLLTFAPFAITLLLLCQVRSAILKAMFGASIFLAGSLHIASRASLRAFHGLLLITTGLGALVFLMLPKFIEYSIAVQQDNELAIERSLTTFDYEVMKTARRDALPRFLNYLSEVPMGAGFARVGAAAGAFKDLAAEDRFFGFKYFFADNFWITTLIEIGIPGMVLMTIMLVMILWIGFRNFFKIKDIDLRVLHLAVWCPLASIFIGLYGAEGVLYNPEACFFWFFSGVLMKIPVLDQQQRSLQTGN